ncbi:GNAT family N-acetyltransferase [Leifsonia sp. YAF41]|uniref:GNAT family N-acetyltransferase n=1 Tax=Leifsonia sp. YAF41 TaxID=3233086 RepID=UPI003F9C53E7
MTTPTGLTTLPFTPRPIHTDRLLLRPLTEADVDDVFAYQSIPEVVEFLPWPVRNRAESRAHTLERSHFTQLKDDNDRLVLGVELRADDATGDEKPGQVIGDLSVFLGSGANAQIEIGWVFHPDHQRKGYATEAARALLDLAFAQIGAHRVFARLDPHNTASVALCQRLGMRQEAYFRESEIFKGAWGDLAIYAILNREWADEA